ncbi:MAG: ABC transporter substrate-binding protein [Chloroflexota bacterium]
MNSRGKHVWIVAAVLASVSLLLASCAPAAAPTPAAKTAPEATKPVAKPAAPAPTAKPAAPAPSPKPAAGQPKYGGSVTRMRENYPDMLDPHLCRGANWWNDVLGPVYNGLLTLDEEMETVHDLVEKWEQPSDTQYVLHLRKGTKFHDTPEMKGRELTSEDVKWNIERMATDDKRMMRRWQFQTITKIETPDKYTVKLTLKEPTAPFVSFMAQPYNYIVGKEAVEKYGDLIRHEAGTGPFCLKSWNEKISYKLAKNTNYFMKGVPYLDEVNVIIVPDAATRLAAFRSGRGDYVHVEPPDVASLKKTNPSVTLSSQPRANVIMMFHPDKKPFTDQRVRQAFSLAIGRQELIDIVMEGQGDISGPVFGSVAASWKLPPEELKRLYKVDIAKAKKLMAEAGYPDGFPLEVKVSSQRKDCMETIIPVTEQLKQIGVQVKQQVLEHTTLVAQRNAGDYVCLLHAGTSCIEVGERITQYWKTGGQYHLHDKDLDRLLEEQQRAVDTTKRRQIINQLERLMIERAHVLFVYGYSVILARQPNIKGPLENSVFAQHLVAYQWIKE